MKCVCPDVEPDEADVKFMLAEVDMDGNEQIDRNELLPLLAVWKELAQQKESVAPSSARIGTPAASEPNATRVLSETE